MTPEAPQEKPAAPFPVSSLPSGFLPLPFAMKVTEERNWGIRERKGWRQFARARGPPCCFVPLTFSEFKSISIFSSQSSAFLDPLKRAAQ